MLGLLAQHDAASFLGDVFQVDVEALAVLVRPSGADARPVGLLALACDVKQPVSRAVGCVGFGV